MKKEHFMFYKKESWAISPKKAYETDAGWDLYAPEDIIVLPHDFSNRIDLGVAFGTPKGYCGMVLERSSQGKVGVDSIGRLVDFGYNGNVHVTLVNHGFDDYKVKKGDRICQIIFPMIYTGDMVEVKELPKSERGKNAHGSSGK